jgi:hypothetical protein
MIKGRSTRIQDWESFFGEGTHGRLSPSPKKVATREVTRARIRAPFNGEKIFLRHKVTQHHWQCEGQDWQCQGQDSGWRRLRTLVKTHTGKTSSLRPVGCIFDQFPTKGIPTTSLRLARQVFASHEKSPPCTRSLRLARPPSGSDWYVGHDTRCELRARAPPPTRMREWFPAPCKYNSWQPSKQLTPIRDLMQAWLAARPSHRHHLPLCHTQARPEALEHPLRRARA